VIAVTKNLEARKALNLTLWKTLSLEPIQHEDQGAELHTTKAQLHK